MTDRAQRMHSFGPTTKSNRRRGDAFTLLVVKTDDLICCAR